MRDEEDYVSDDNVRVTVAGLLAEAEQDLADRHNAVAEAVDALTLARGERDMAEEEVRRLTRAVAALDGQPLRRRKPKDESTLPLGPAA